MLDVTLADSGDYLELDSDAWWESFGDEQTSLILTESYRDYCESRGISDDYATVETVTAWLTAFSPECTPTGLYGEDGPMVFHTIEQDTPFTSDGGYVYANVENDEYSGTVIVEYAYEYSTRTNASVCVWDASSVMDGAEPLMFNYVTASCAYCETYWESDNGGHTFYPGGNYSGESLKLDAFVTYSEVTLENVTQCPICGHGPINFGTY